jgi:hypothetical protein
VLAEWSQASRLVETLSAKGILECFVTDGAPYALHANLAETERDVTIGVIADRGSLELQIELQIEARDN